MNKAIVATNISGGESYCSPALPLTCADILALRGKPTVRKITKAFPKTGGVLPITSGRANLHNSHAKQESMEKTSNEWIYCYPNKEEHFFFKNERLIRWEKVPNDYYIY